MSLGKRLTALFHGNRDDDPRVALDASYEAQSALLQTSRRGVADVATARRRVELQLRTLQHNADRLHAEAQAAMDAGDEATARDALVRRSALTAQAAELGPQLERLTEQEGRLTVQVQRLEAKVEAFRSQKETLKASYSAAEAQTKIGEAYAGISEELGDVGLAVERARARTEQMQAHADAVEELLQAGGAVPGETQGEAAQRQIAAMAATNDVEGELARLRRPALGTGAGSPERVEEEAR